MSTYVISTNELYHHGVLGMKWGVRRYQSYAENPKLSDRQQRKIEKREAKRNAKADKVAYKFTKKLMKSEAQDERDNSRYNVQLSKIEAKYGTDSAHADLQRKYMEYTKAGQTKYNDILTNWSEAKQKAIRDPEYKKTSEYKAAKSVYDGQNTMELIYTMYYGLPSTARSVVKGEYTNDAIRKDRDKLDAWRYENKARRKLEKQEYKARKKAEKKGYNI